MKNIVIIGNGISGVTAARHIRKRSDHSITIISAESDHFYSRTALGDCAQFEEAPEGRRK